MDPSAADSDALSYRHDGSSPLPLGLEWSPGPVRVGREGEESVWPGVPADSWCFSVTIPAWVTVTPTVNHRAPGAAAAAVAMGPIDPFARASPIVLYRVVVAVRSPRGTTTGVRLLRRFSDFLALHSSLVNAFPQRRIPDPPPKHRLLFVSSNNTLISQRRLALQTWLTLLLEDLEVSRSPPMAAFLDLPDAARLAALSLEAESAQERDPRDGNITSIANNSSSQVRGVPGAFSATGGDSASGVDSNKGEGESMSEGHRALSGGAGDNAQLSSELLEAYLSQRRGVGVPADCQSTGESSGLPSPSPTSSFYRVLSASSLASLTLPPGAEAADTAGTEEGQGPPPAGEPASAGAGAGAGAGEGEGAGGGAASDGRGLLLGPLSDAGNSEPSGRAGAGVSGTAGSGRDVGTPAHASKDEQTARVPSPAFGATGGPLSDPLSSNAPHVPSLQPPPQPPPQLPPQFQGVHVTSQQGDWAGEEPLLVVQEEARPVVHRQLAVLQRRLQVAQADMSALIERLQQETAVSEFLTQKVKDVEAELDSERRGSGSAVAQAMAEREERLVAVEWELEEERVKLADALAAVASHQERERSLEAQLDALAQRLLEAEGATTQQRAQQGVGEGGEDESQAAERAALVGRAREEGRAEGREEAEKRTREEGERTKGEVRALAKEVKSLRKALAASQGEEAHQRQQAEAYRRLLVAEQQWSRERRRRKERTIHEVEVLAQRLRETAVTALGREVAVISVGGGGGTAGLSNRDDEKKGLAGVEDEGAVLAENLELLATSDSRIELILAEALLLKELPELSQPGSILQDGLADTGPKPGAASLQNGGTKDSEKAGLSLMGSGVTTGDEVTNVDEIADQVKQRLGEEESNDRELLFSAVGLLVEMAQQRRSINALLRHAYASKMQ